jgi:hypothetical protein
MKTIQVSAEAQKSNKYSLGADNYQIERKIMVMSDILEMKYNFRNCNVQFWAEYIGSQTRVRH